MSYQDDFDRRQRRQREFQDWMSEQGFSAEQKRKIMDFVDAQSEDYYDEGSNSANYAAAVAPSSE